MQSRPQIDQLMRRSDRRSAGGPATTVLPPCPSPGQKADLRLVIRVYSGHPDQIHLSRELARRGHHVEHQYCASYTSGRGATRRREGDPESVGVRAIELGLMVAPGDADAASAALRNLLSSTAVRDRMGTAARRYAERTFDVGRVGERFESLLCDIKKGRQGKGLASRTRTRDLTDTHRLTAET